jgi:hypothetical protein
MPRLLPITAATFRPHALHSAERNWPETNCYVDLWIEVLNAFGHDPRAALGFTVGQDFEGDQFTFFKFPLEELQALFGLSVQELAIYDSLEQHAQQQLERNRLVLVEMDSFYLPDTRGTAYQHEHVKTTVGIASLDAEKRQLGYFHNAGFYELSGDDFDGVFRRIPALKQNPDVLFPYVEFVKRDGPVLSGAALLAGAKRGLRDQLRRRPGNPIAKYRAELPRHLDALLSRPMAYFHLYAFNLLRMLGANFELLGSHGRWLEEQGEQGLTEIITAAEQIAATAKAFQFQLARGVNKKKFGDFSSTLDTLERAHDTAVGGLAKRYG